MTPSQEPDAVNADAATPAGDAHATVVTGRPPAAQAGQRFVIVRPHAVGGLGKVSVARDEELHREVALKELHDCHADDPQSRARFVQEAEITGGLEHPGIVPIYGLGQYADGRPFYAMRLIRGTSLADAIARFHAKANPRWSTSWSVRQLRRLLARLIDACNAMEYAHSRGVLHRDVKPSNIMLGQYGETLVVDWGLAKPLGCAGVDAFLVGSDVPVAFPEAALKPLSGSGSAPTQMGSAVGTPMYMSPEQAAGRLDELGPATDVYSLGATLYTLLTGRAPQDDEDLGVVLQRVQRGDFPKPRDLNGAVPRGLEAICLKAMALRPADRYASPRKLADDIEAWLADEPVAARREPWPTRSWRWVRKHRTLVTSATGILLAALLSTSIGLWRLSESNRRERDAKDDAIGARNAALTARAEAERQSSRNAELLALARSALERYETLSKSEELKRYGMETLRSDLQEAALEFYAALGKQTGESEQVRADRGGALYRLGTTYWQLGRVEESLTAFRDSLAIFRQLRQEFPPNVEYRRQAALVLSGIGELLTENQQAAASAEPLTESLALLEALHQANPAGLEDRQDFAYAILLEGERLRQLGRVDEAANRLTDAVALLREVDASSLAPEEQRDLQFRLARALAQLATLEGEVLWRFDAAREHFEEARQLMASLHDAHSELGDLGFTLAQILRHLGLLEARNNSVDQARVLFEQAMATLDQVELRSPDVPHYRQEMAEVLHSLGGLKAPFQATFSDEAVAQLEQAVAITRRLVEQFPQQNDRRLSLAHFLSSLAYAYDSRGRADEAVAHFQEAAQLIGSVRTEAGDSVDALYLLAAGQLAVAERLAASQRHADALTMLDRAEATFGELTELSPRFAEAQLALVSLSMTRGASLEAEGRVVDALAELDRILARCDLLADLASAPWMRSIVTTVAFSAKASRVGYLALIRDGGLYPLADRGSYETAAEQARRLVEITGEASDCYVAAQTLAYTAGKLSEDTAVTAEQRASLGEQLAAETVSQLTAAWQRGYLLRSDDEAGWFDSRPTLETIEEAAEFSSLRNRADYQALVSRIQTDNPATEPSSAEGESRAPGANEH